MEVSDKQFIVISLTASLPTYVGCSVVPEDAMITMINSRVHGPASEAECHQWITDNCDCGK
jgi:hypothetical protein